MGKLIPVLLALVGLAAGTGGGYLLRPVPAGKAALGACADVQTAVVAAATEPAATAHDYVKGTSKNCTCSDGGVDIGPV